MSKKEIEKVLKEKPSAYRSMKMSQLGITPKNKRNKKDLMNWTKEEWLNLNALIDMNIELPCGQKYKGQTDKTVCRPKKKVNEKTPTPLAYDLTEKQIKKAIKKKNKGERIKWNEL
jgi:RecG-like helicase